MRDARAAWKWLLEQHTRIDTSKVVLYGRSLGGAVTIQLARQLCDANAVDPKEPLPAGVIVGNTFTSISDLLGSIYPFLNHPLIKKHLLRLQWRSIDHLPHVRVPCLLFV